MPISHRWLPLLLLIPLTVKAETPNPERSRVAVMDLKPLGVSEATAATLTGILLSGLAEGAGIDLLGKSDLASILSLEESNLLLGCSPDDPSCVVEHGHALGNAIMVWGTVGQVGDRVVITVAMVNVKAGATIGRGSRSVNANDGDAMIAATLDLAAELRAALGLTSKATWTPILAALARVGFSFSDYSGANGTLDTWLPFLQLEVDLFLLPQVVLYLQAGLGTNKGRDGSQENKAFTAWFIPLTVGAKYRWVRPWLTPYAGIGIGLGILQLANQGGTFSVQGIAGVELNPWQVFGFTVEGGVVFSKFFKTGSQNFIQVGGTASMGVVYRF